VQTAYFYNINCLVFFVSLRKKCVAVCLNATVVSCLKLKKFSFGRLSLKKSEKLALYLSAIAG